jgi:diguanylate cyclase (GGDEF)-like protein
MEEVQRVYKVYIDATTGFYDRRTMWYRLAEEVSRARRYRYPLSLMLVQVGASEPQQVEERVLRLADVLKRHTRSVDILVRYSEDALALLLPCTNETGAVHLAERIRHLASAEEPPSGTEEESPLSIGITSTRGEYRGDKIALVEQVEWALNKAQSEGGKIVVVPAPNEPPVAEENGE